MDKQLYAKCLSERLIEMSAANDAALNVFNKELKPKMNNLDGEKVNNGSISYKKLKRIKHNSTKLTERRRQFLRAPKGDAVSLPNILWQ